jgi:hypothetical protein
MVRCFACCTAAILMIALAALGKRVAGGFLNVTRASNSSHNQLLLHVNAAPASEISASKSQSVIERYKQFPLSFEPNREQTDAAVKFLARGEGYILFLTDKDAVFTLGKAPQNTSVLRMSLLGANAKPSFTGMEELPGKSNYLIGNRPERWHTNIPNYRKVAEHNIYPGIDLVYYGTQRQLEYDFVIAPGASPGKIQIGFKGASNLHTDADGDLVLSVAGNNDVRLHKPIAYQQMGAEKQLVAANYIVRGNDSVEFGIGEYDARRPLIVDPILAYSSYLGGSNIDTANAIAVAPDGTAFIAGGTYSSDFPTQHPLQPNLGGGPDFPRDAFVAKISADGSTVLYATYLGGENEDTANGIAVDAFGNAYVTGTTLSPHFPVTTGSFDESCGGDGKCGATFNPGGAIVSNAFASKLNIAGSALVYSGFIGFYENVHGNAIAIDTAGNAYVTGQVGPNIPPTVTIAPPNVPPPPFPDGSAIRPPAIVVIDAAGDTFDFGIFGASNAFVTKISATGSSITYSSYVGGTDEDSGYGIAVDGSGNAYVTGLANSADFPTANALQFVNGGAGDAFLAKINTNTSGPASLTYSTFLGGKGLDQGNAVAADNAGNAYVAGVTNSIAGTLGFTPVGGLQSNCTLDSSNACEGDAFVTKLNTNLSGAASLVFFTYLGGTHADAATGIAVDTTGIYVTGSTVSADFPVTSSAFQHPFGGGNADAFVTKFDPSGASLIYSSYLGGSNTDVATGIAVDTAGSAYVSGQSCSVDFPLANPVQSNPGGNCDAFISKVSILAGIAINPSGLTFPTLSLGATSLPETVTITNGDNPLTISSISVTGADSGDFASTNTCGGSLPVGGTCTVSATFTPTSQGIRKASITIVDNAPGSPQVLNLTGSTSSVILSASSLSFGTVAVGATSVAQPITLTNSGTGVLTVTGITASSGFNESNTCGVALQAGDNCVINVTYSPIAIGATIGALAITDSAPGPQIVQLTGTASVPSFTISPVSSSPPVSAGQTAPYTLMITPDPGFTLPVTLGCTGLPHGATCEVSSNPVTLNGPTSIQLIITTAVRAMAPPSEIKMNPGTFDGLRHFGGWLTWLIALLSLATLASVKRRPAMAGFGLVAILFVVLVGCSGGNSAGTPAGTPAGSYQITVTGTSGSITKSINPPLTLQVK